MIKLKVSAIAKCDDCGTTQKEREQYGSGIRGIYRKLRAEGWHVPEDVEHENAYCPACAELRRCGGEADE